MTRPDYDLIMDGLDENDAILITTYWRSRFGWSGTLRTRADASDVFAELDERHGTETELTDAIWARIVADPVWAGAPFLDDLHPVIAPYYYEAQTSGS